MRAACPPKKASSSERVGVGTQFRFYPSLPQSLSLAKCRGAPWMRAFAVRACVRSANASDRRRGRIAQGRMCRMLWLIRTVSDNIMHNIVRANTLRRSRSFLGRPSCEELTEPSAAGMVTRSRRGRLVRGSIRCIHRGQRRRHQAKCIKQGGATLASVHAMVVIVVACT